MRYFIETNALHKDKMFDWKINTDDQYTSRSLDFELDEDDATLKLLIEPILRHRGLFDSSSVPLPSHLIDRKLPKAKTVHERLCQWILTDWTADRELQMIRDLTVLFKLAMEPSSDEISQLLTEKLFWGVLILFFFVLTYFLGLVDLVSLCFSKKVCCP